MPPRSPDTGVFRDPEAHPVAIQQALDLQTGMAWRDWEPEMLREFCGVREQRLVDKILATQVACTNPDVFEEWHLFQAVGEAFNHRRVSFQWVDPLTYLEAAWTCVALRELPSTGDFRGATLRYIGVLMQQDGLCFFPWVGGDGYVLGDGEGEWANGVVSSKVVDQGRKLRKLWLEAPEVQELEPGDIDESDDFQVQLAKLAAGQTYIREQKPATPGDYK